MFYIATESSRTTSSRLGKTGQIKFAVLVIGAILAIIGLSKSALAQPPNRQTRLEALRQQNALQQQQAAVQSAAQQTTLLVQSVNQSVGQQSGAMPTISFQSQVSALQIALQQTNTLLQSSSRSNSGLVQMALQQRNTLQSALQQTMSIMGTSSSGTQLNAAQLQMLAQEQNSLTQLLTITPGLLQGRGRGR